MTALSSIRYKTAIAFLIVYLVWGSTYLAIRIGVADLPPALFAGVRFIVSGILLGLYARLSGLAFPQSLREWKMITVVAVLLLVGANGLVVWGEQWMPSNQAALIVATTALWIAGFGTLGSQGEPLTWRSGAGLALGFLGVVMLLLPRFTEFRPHYVWAALAILLSSLLWASGSMYSKRQRPSTAPLMAAAMQMLVGGFILSMIGFVSGETAAWQWTLDGMVALGYLIVFGAVAYAAFVWLLHNVTPAQLGTYAYVNPVVAVLLGWAVLGERLDLLQMMGMLVILSGVVLVSTLSVKTLASNTSARHT
jgi:drug/metabolite transporter (DMT)-like permease